MTIQIGELSRNAMLDSLETTLGASPILELRSGAQPANCAAADSGTLLCTITLPADFLAAAAAGVKAKSGTWSGTGAAGASTGTAAGHYRIKNAGGTVCHQQGKVGATGDGTADMTMDNVSIAQNQPVTVNTYSLTAPNP